MSIRRPLLRLGYDHASNMLNTIWQGSRRNKHAIFAVKSKETMGILRVLTDEGFIRGVTVAHKATHVKVYLKYTNGKAVVNSVDRISCPSRRLSVKIRHLPAHCNGLGIFILSTKRGVLSDSEARRAGVGGEIIASVV